MLPSTGPSPPSRVPRFIACGLGALTALLGVVVIFGWYTGNVTLIQVLPAFVAMQFNTALGFVASGAALLALIAGNDRWARVAGATANHRCLSRWRSSTRPPARWHQCCRSLARVL